MATRDDVRTLLKYDRLVHLVGECSVLHVGSFGHYSARTDFYLEPKNPPVIPVLSQVQVNALNGAAYYKRTPTKELAAIPLEFARSYNAILREVAKSFGDQAHVTSCVFASNLASSRVNLGHIDIADASVAGEVVRTTVYTITDPALKEQLSRYEPTNGGPELSRIPASIKVRLFPPGLGTRVYEYEKGFYFIGNVVEWKDLVYKGRYIDVNQLSPDQLRDIARGEEPYPTVEYQTDSDFVGDSAEVSKLFQERASKRNSRESTSWMFGFSLANHGSEDDGDQDYPGGDFDEHHPLLKRERTGDPQAIHTH